MREESWSHWSSYILPHIVPLATIIIALTALINSCQTREQTKLLIEQHNISYRPYVYALIKPSIRKTDSGREDLIIQMNLKNVGRVPANTTFKKTVKVDGKEIKLNKPTDEVCIFPEQISNPYVILDNEQLAGKQIYAAIEVEYYGRDPKRKYNYIYESEYNPDSKSFDAKKVYGN
jgi:hypothetical protein